MPRKTKNKSHKKRRTRRYKKRNLSKSKKRRPIKRRRRKTKRRTRHRRRRRIMKGGGCENGSTGQQITGVPMNKVISQYPEPSSSPSDIMQSGGGPLRNMAEFFGLGDATLGLENAINKPSSLMKTLNGGEHPLSNDPTVHHNLDTGTKVGDNVPNLGEIQTSAVNEAISI